MNRNDSPSNFLRGLIAAALLCFLLLAVYFDSFDAGWQFDDKPNILDNRYIHLRDLKPESLVQTFFTQPTNPNEIGDNLYRPISFLTFAINWYFGKDKVLGYHVINLLIHCLTTTFLFIAILNIFRTPNFKEKVYGNRCVIAFLSTALWAINPIQTQAVTYIVQRMASLAAMFYILSLLCYIKCRLSSSSPHRIFFLLVCALSFLLALGSKENAAMLPVSLMLIELTCFQRFNWRWGDCKKYYLAGVMAGGVIAIGIWFFNSNIFNSLLNSYHHRPFTFSERLLTEPRIVIFYLSQIFFPLPARLSIEHDVTLSISLFQPWTTLPAILLTVLLIGLGISQIRKRPAISLALLFFFLNHIIESTVLPLELIFEHRNYLPSMFLFLPLAAGLQWLYDDCAVKKRPLMAGTLAGLVVAVIVCLGVGTFVRNLAWATEQSLWRDAMKKAPQSARPLTNLAWQMTHGSAAHASQYDEALKLYEKALLLQKSKSSSNSIIMNNMAGIYSRQGKHRKAVELLENAITIAPGYNRGRYHLAKILLVNGKWNAAAAHIEYLLAKNDAHEKYLNLKGMVSLHQKNYDAAIHYFRKSLNSNPLYKESLMNLGIAYSLSGNHGSAEAFLIRAHQAPPKNSMIPLMGLIENRLRAADYKWSQKYAGILSSNHSRSAIENQLDSLSKDLLSLFLSAESISKVIENHYANNTRASN